jgi:hypothetical protein
MQNPEDYKDFQILGANVRVILDGFGSFTLLASKILLETGLGTMDAEGIGMAVIDPAKWYPLDGFLRAFQRIGAEFGDFTLRQAGVHINKQATDPGDILKNINSAFTYLDQGYHYNHGKNGEHMFNPQNGQMMEGIGHFTCKTVATPPPGKKQVTLVVDTPYPCAFDEGIVIGMAQRFDPTAKVTHDLKSCRKKGATACHYNVIWK